ncbi:hypothetical protein DAI22_08g141700 [Oryza sativa Japonica Group]|nr:hypothetical protein DAI22_08g141700 [Oryza sativa Japonica Group]
MRRRQRWEDGGEVAEGGNEKKTGGDACAQRAGPRRRVGGSGGHHHRVLQQWQGRPHCAHQHDHSVRGEAVPRPVRRGRRVPRCRARPPHRRRRLHCQRPPPGDIVTITAAAANGATH